MLTLSKQKRTNRVRFSLKQKNKELMRLSVYKSSRHIYVQLINDIEGKIVCSASSLKTEKNKNSCNVENAKLLGAEIAKKAIEKGIKNIYLDRGPNMYHGIVKTIADEARLNGLNF